MKKVWLVLLSLFIITALTGCGSNTAKVGQEDYISKEKTNYVVIDPQQEVDDKTDWDVVDSIALNTVKDSYKITYLKENHPEVQTVKRVSKDFLEAMLNIDYKTYTGQEGYPYFTQRRIAEDKQENQVEKRKQSVVSKEIKEEMTDIQEFSGIYFNKDFTKCRVDVAPIIKLVAAKNEFLGKGVELNKEYLYTTILWLQKENDVWKIDAFDFVGLKEKQ